MIEARSGPSTGSDVDGVNQNSSLSIQIPRL